MEDFRRELLGQEGKRTGRFDARFCADHQYVIGTGAFDSATDDAATAGVSSAHLSGFHQHLATDLGYHSHLHYRPLNNVTIEAAWDWRHKAPGIDAAPGAERGAGSVRRDAPQPCAACLHHGRGV